MAVSWCLTLQSHTSHRHCPCTCMPCYLTVDAHSRDWEIGNSKLEMKWTVLCVHTRPIPAPKQWAYRSKRQKANGRRRAGMRWKARNIQHTTATRRRLGLKSTTINERYKNSYNCTSHPLLWKAYKKSHSTQRRALTRTHTQNAHTDTCTRSHILMCVRVTLISLVRTHSHFPWKLYTWKNSTGEQKKVNTKTKPNTKNCIDTWADRQRKK